MSRTDFEAAQNTRSLSGLAAVPLDVAYRDDGAGPPVVLLHGIATWSYLWRGVIDRLQTSARVVTPDLLGYGHSDHRDCFDRSVRRQARMVVALLDDLGIESATVVGHDIGGAVAQVLAVEHGKRVDALALVDSVAYGSWPSTSMVELGDPNILDRPDEIMEILRHDARVGHAEDTDPAPFVRGMVAPYDSDAGRRSIVRNASALSTNHTMELADQLPSVEVPALILWGERDRWQPPSDAERLASALPNAELETVPEGNHWLPWDHPAETAAALDAFVSTRVS